MLFAVIAATMFTTYAWACGGMDHNHGNAGAQSSPGGEATGANVDVDRFLAPYFAIRASLSADRLDNVATNTEVFIQAAEAEFSQYSRDKKGIMENVSGKTKAYAKNRLQVIKRVPGLKGYYYVVDQAFLSDPETVNRGLLKKMIKAAHRLDKRNISLKDSRNAFGELSDTLVEYLRANTDSDYAEKLQFYYCGMAKHQWVQNVGENIGNPYLGTQMPDCGKTVALFGNADENDTSHQHGL